MTATTNETMTTTTHETTRRPTAHELIQAYKDADYSYDAERDLTLYLLDIEGDEIPGTVHDLIELARDTTDSVRRDRISNMLFNMAGSEHQEEVFRAYIQYEDEEHTPPTRGLVAEAMASHRYGPRIARGAIKTLKQANRDYTLWNEIIPVWEPSTNTIRAIRREDLDETDNPDEVWSHERLPRHIEIDTCLPSPSYWTREYLARGLAAKLKNMVLKAQDTPYHDIRKYVNGMACFALAM